MSKEVYKLYAVSDSKHISLTIKAKPHLHWSSNLIDKIEEAVKDEFPDATFSRIRLNDSADSS